MKACTTWLVWMSLVLSGAPIGLAVVDPTNGAPATTTEKAHEGTAAQEASSITNLVFNSLDDAEEAIRTQIADIKAWLDRSRSDVETSNGSTRTNLSNQLSQLQASLDDMEAKLRTWKETQGESAWENTKASIQEAYENMKEDWNQARKRMESELNQ